MRGWEHVTPADLARRAAKPALAKATLRERPQKFHAEPCIVTTDGTLFTTTDIQTAETGLALHSGDLDIGVGALLDRAARVGIRGLWFASLKEGRRYLELRALERHGDISDLRCQVAFDLYVISRIDGLQHTIGKWIADFVYRRVGEIVTEDTKGVKTPLYKRSRRHFEAQYGLRILET